MSDFIHLHNHSQFSLLDGASSVEGMISKAAREGQKAVALTDHGNMFGAFKFVNEAHKKGIKPIVGCEFYLVENRFKQSFSKVNGEYDKRYHQLMLAKNTKGYENLSTLCSLGYIEGLYSKFPRIDKELVATYHEGLIATSCCIGAEIPKAIIRGDMRGAEEKLQWWLNLFGDDYYIEIMRHKGLKNINYRNEYGKRVKSGISQEDVNRTLLHLAEKYNVKVIATNDSHYLEEEDWLPHDILLCVNTGNKFNDEKGDGKGKRFGFSSSDYYFKSTNEMKNLFADVPTSIENTMEIYEKVDQLKLTRDVLLPSFLVPQDFDGQDDYLRHITYQGAKERYGELTAIIKERLDFELSVIKDSGYPGYFLIVQDFTQSAKELGVIVGPGRGSAAGSAVAYCLGITNIDPIKYNLLFERFLNPERVSMPDIDIDFDDEGRQKVIDYVVDKYGKNQVAQIITYGTMKAKSAIRDVGRVLDIPLSEVNKIAKLIPDKSLSEILDKSKNKELKNSLRGDEYDNVETLQGLNEMNADGDIAKMLRFSQKLEGSVRNTGIHACGIIITPDDVKKYVPVSTTKDNDLLITQFDNSVAENAGLLKMDFLGLKTLSIIRDTIKMIKELHNIEIDIDKVPLDDMKTYEIFQEGATVGVFQFESMGMQKQMKNLKPTEFNDLIALNALYRPGPMQYIPDYIERKHGQQKVEYDLPEMEEYLKETYGISVYQEQVMLLSQKLASFSKGQADSLRKGMGKKKKEIIDKLFPLFLENGIANGHPKEVLEKIWKDWESFASYAFNKSHATCYSYIAYQTAYLKAHYPSEFMASVLTHSKTDIAKVSFFMREVRKMGITIRSPHVNSSKLNFTVNEAGEIVIGLSALKGIGEGPVEAIVKAREEGGAFSDIYDFIKRVDIKSINKRVLEPLALSGALDNLGANRAQITYVDDQGAFISELLKYGGAFQEEGHAAIQSLFAGMEESTIHKPELPEVEEYDNITKLEKEKEITGLYVSGHPLDDYELEYRLSTNATLVEYDSKMQDKTILKVAGIITSFKEVISKRGNKLLGIFTIVDYNGSKEFLISGEQYLKFKHLLYVGNIIFINGIFSFNKYSQKMYFNINEIQLLSEVGSDKLSVITLKLNLNAIDKSITVDLLSVFDSKDGQHKVEVEFSLEDGKILKTITNRRTNINNDLIMDLKEMGVSFSLN